MGDLPKSRPSNFFRNRSTDNARTFSDALAAFQAGIEPATASNKSTCNHCLAIVKPPSYVGCYTDSDFNLFTSVIIATPFLLGLSTFADRDSLREEVEKLLHLGGTGVEYALVVFVQDLFYVAVGIPGQLGENIV